MANFSYNGPSGITFSADSFEEIYSPGQTGAVVNNIYSLAYTENNSRRVSFYGYLWSNFRFQATINLSRRSGNSFTASSLDMKVYSGYTPRSNFSLEGSVSFDGIGITGGNIKKERFTRSNGVTFSYTGSYDILRVLSLTSNHQFSLLHKYLTKGNDTFNGTKKSDTIESGAGNDLVNAKNGADIVYGQKGNDKLNGANGNDQLFGGSGNDIINGGFGNDSLVGGTGIDTAVFSNRANIVDLATTSIQNTGDGRDVLTGIENVNGGAGNDIIAGNSGANTLNGGNGNDILYGDLGNDRLVGGSGKDTALFSASANTINLGSMKRQNTGDGNDVLTGIENVNGGSGNDIIRGNNAANTLRGEDDADKLYGNNGNDKLYGGSGNDLLNGGNGNDRLAGGDGVDTAVFSSKNNRISLSSTSGQNTGDGRDILIGIENINGAGGNDIIRGNSNANTFRGGSGKDKLYGMGGVDILYGETGNDTLYGGTGDDILNGGTGNDTLYGGAGADIFWINKGSGRSLITDYDSDADSVELLGGLTESDLTFNYVGGDTKIKYGKDLMAIVQNTIAEDITFI